MISPDQLGERLQTVPLFARCHPSDLRIIAERSTTSVTSTPAPCCCGPERSRATSLVLLEGAAVVQRNGEITGKLEAGDHFGELALLDPAPRSADVVMTSDGTVSVLDRAN